MNTAVLGGLVEQWVWRCQMIATQYQLRQPINLQAEVARLVEQAETEARQLGDSGPVLLVEDREQARHQRPHRGAAGAAQSRQADRSGAQFARPRQGFARAVGRLRHRRRTAAPAGVERPRLSRLRGCMARGRAPRREARPIIDAMLLVPGEGLEPPTNGLQNRCSTAELTRQIRRTGPMRKSHSDVKIVKSH